MDFVTLGIGIAVGAIFAPFWMMLWNKGKALVTKKTA
jgi:hypothetical protein